METADDKKPQGPNEIAGFVSKTYEILNNTQFHKIIFWSTNGSQFIIKDINKFQEIVLPKYFRHRNVNSFIRQLNMYGFHKARKQNTRSVFSHPYFIRNKEHLLHLVRRKIKNCEEGTESAMALIQPQPIKSVRSIKELPTTNTVSKPTSSHRLELVSPIKSLISTNELIRTNINISIRRISFCDMDSHVNLPLNDDDDCVSIEDEIQRHRDDFRGRVMGLSLITTSVFLQQMKDNY